MSKGKLVGVILAAGKGTRMTPFSVKYPKPILPICNKAIMEYQIDHLKTLGVKDVLIVIGHLGYQIAKYFGDGKALGVNITYVEQKDTLGIAHALGQIEPFVKSPFVLFLGDIFFETDNLARMIDLHREGAGGETASVLAVKREKDEDKIKRNFAIILEEGSDRVKRVIEKPRYVHNELKGCGLYLFDLHIFDAIRRTPRTAMRDEYELTESIQILVQDGYPVRIAEVVVDDINLSYAYDLLNCSLLHMKKQKLGNVIGKDVEIHPEAKITHSVIGDRVRIKEPIEVRDSMIFPDTVVSSKESIRRYILTPENAIDCSVTH